MLEYYFIFRIIPSHILLPPVKRKYEPRNPGGLLPRGSGQSNLAGLLAIIQGDGGLEHQIYLQYRQVTRGHIFCYCQGRGGGMSLCLENIHDCCANIVQYRKYPGIRQRKAQVMRAALVTRELSSLAQRTLQPILQGLGFEMQKDLRFESFNYF